ncbi:MAG: divalent-cation tolerance protein CutA [Alphaproteobacteria bacterium]|nr:MAG: divalent-cation tolerance protein CutA [Alphaproteobacteria bacterium]
MSGLVTLYVTCADHAEAESIARHLVAQHLAACANIWGGITSVYRWQGGIETGREVALLLKTRADLIDEASAAIRARHSYDVPCIVAWPIVGGDGDYCDWVAAETRKG